MKATTETILEAIKRAWNGPIAAVIPGGVHHGKPASATVFPYAVAKVSLAGSEGNSGTSSLDMFRLTISTYSVEGVNCNRAHIERTIIGFNWASITLPGGPRALHSDLATVDVLDDGQTEGRDVRLTANAFDLLIQNEA